MAPRKTQARKLRLWYLVALAWQRFILDVISFKLSIRLQGVLVMPDMKESKLLAINS